MMLTSAKAPTLLPSEVVLATPADLDELFSVLMENYRENGIYSMNPQKVAAWAAMGCHRDKGAIGLIKGPDGIEATCGVVLGSMWYSDDIYVEEVWNYVRPDHRQKPHSKHLIMFAKWFAENLGVPLLMGIVTTSRLAAKERLYERELPKVGALFLHGLPWVTESLDPMADLIRAGMSKAKIHRTKKQTHRRLSELNKNG